MARSSAVDPLEKFRFAVSWSTDTGSESTALARLGFHDIQMPKRSTNKGTYREGIDPDISQIFAGLSTMEDITLNRGVIATDPNGEFYKWITAVHNPTTGHEGRDAVAARKTDAASATYKKDVTIQMLGRTGDVVRQWTLFNAFPTNFVPGSDLNADEDGEKSLEQLTLSYEDFKEETPESTTLVAISADYSSD